MNYPPQQAYPAAPMAQPKPRRWPWLVAVIGAFGIGVVVGVAASNQDETTPPTQAQGPATTMHSGIYQVGADVQPGQYETTGPEDKTHPLGCYWAQLKNNNGQSGEIINNGVLDGPGSIRINEGEFVELRGDCTWTKTG